MGQKVQPRGFRLGFHLSFHGELFHEGLKYGVLYNHSYFHNKICYGQRTVNGFLIKNLFEEYLQKTGCILNNLSVYENPIGVFICIESYYFRYLSVNSNISISRVLSHIQKHLEVNLSKKPVKIYHSVLDISSGSPVKINYAFPKVWDSLNCLLFSDSGNMRANGFATIFSKLLGETSNHQRLIEYTHSLFEMAFSREIFKGLKLQVKGRINGVERARSSVVKVGAIPLQTVNSTIDCGYSSSITPYGKCGIKVWFFKLNIRIRIRILISIVCIVYTVFNESKPCVCYV